MRRRRRGRKENSETSMTPLFCLRSLTAPCSSSGVSNTVYPLRVAPPRVEEQSRAGGGGASSGWMLEEEERRIQGVSAAAGGSCSHRQTPADSLSVSGVTFQNKGLENYSKINSTKKLQFREWPLEGCLQKY